MVSKELLSEMFGWDIKFVNPRVNDKKYHLLITMET
jgi:hypothetical protein